MYRVYRALELNLRIKLRPQLVRATPQPLAVPDKPNQVWSMDLMHHQLADGRRFRLFNVLDDFNREGLILQPGQPQPHAYIERYHRTVRYDWLAQTLFDTIAAVQESATRWLWTYHNERPQMALGGITPSMKLALAA